MTEMKIKSNRMGGAPLFALFVGACLMGLSAVASTCIVSTPAGDRDPHHSLSSAAVSVDAGAGTVALIDAALEARFKTFGASLGIGITTKPLGFQFSVK